MKKVIATILLVIVLLIVGMAIAVTILSRDIPEPDVSDLMPDRPEVAPEDNAYTYFIAATNYLYWPTNSTFSMANLSAIHEKRPSSILWAKT